jgi:hypothetical protein
MEPMKRFQLLAPYAAILLMVTGWVACTQSPAPGPVQSGPDATSPQSVPAQSQRPARAALDSALGKWPAPAPGARPRARAPIPPKPNLDTRSPMEIARAACAGARGWECSGIKPLMGAGSTTSNGTWTVPDWYIDPANSTGCAASSNTCTSATCAAGGVGPCRLIDDVVNRWGTRTPVLRQNTTLHLLSSETLQQEAVVLTPVTAFGHYFALIGTPQLISTFTAGVVTPKNRAAGQLLQVATSPALPEATMVVNNTRGGSRARVYREIAADGGPSSTLTLSQPIVQTTPAVWAGNFPSAMPAEDDTWATGDSLSAYSLPIVNLQIWQPLGGDATSSSLGGASWLQYVTVPDQSGSPGNSYFAAGIPQGCVNWYVDMTLEPYFELSGTSGGGITGGFAIDTASVGGMQISDATYWAGLTDLFGASVISYGALDGDAIMNPSINTSSDDFFGAVFTQGPVNVFSSALTKIDDVWVTGQAVIWGPGAVNVEDSAILEKVVGNTWVATLLNTGGLNLRGTGTGTAYTPGAPGVWTSGITLTAANLDAHNGLQNPISGTKYY